MGDRYVRESVIVTLCYTGRRPIRGKIGLTANIDGHLCICYGYFSRVKFDEDGIAMIGVKTRNLHNIPGHFFLYGMPGFEIGDYSILKLVDTEESDNNKF